MTTYLLTLEGGSVVCQIENEADAEKLRAHGVTVTACDDEQAMTPLLAIMHSQARGLMESGIVRAMERLGRTAERMALFAVDAGQAIHILPEAEAREWEADGHTIRESPPKKPGEFAPDHAYNLPKLTERQLRAFGADGWDVAPPTWHVPDDGPNAGKQAPPPRREWWAGSAPDAPPPGFRWMDCRHKQQTKQKMSKRKAQKLARKANRSK